MATSGNNKNPDQLHKLAEAFGRAIENSNQLPEGFPKERMLSVAELLSRLYGVDKFEDRQALAYAQASGLTQT